MTVFQISLGDTLDPAQHRGEVVGINQVVWDVATNTLHVKSDALLAQHTRYALIVTNGPRPQLEAGLSSRRGHAKISVRVYTIPVSVALFLLAA